MKQLHRIYLYLLLMLLCCGLWALCTQVQPIHAKKTAMAHPGKFVLRSAAVKDGGTLPVEYTGDGVSATLPLAWSGAPAGTKSFALIMRHIAPDQIRCYWILYNIPATTHQLPKNVKGVGVWGTNSINHRTEYAPPHSKGPGPKKYI